MSLLYSPTTLGPLTLKNHLVMSPMTRRAAPKSSSTGLPEPASRITLSGEMSRWKQFSR